MHTMTCKTAQYVSGVNKKSIPVGMLKHTLNSLPGNSIGNKDLHFNWVSRMDGKLGRINDMYCRISEALSLAHIKCIGDMVI